MPNLYLGNVFFLPTIRWKLVVYYLLALRASLVHASSIPWIFCILVSGSAVEPSLGGAFEEKYIRKLCKYTVLYTVKSTPHPVKVANKLKFLGIPYTKKYNLCTLIMVLAGILGGGGDICTQVLEHAAALERSSTQNRAALMRSSCDRKNCRLMGFGKTHRIHRTGIFVPIIHLP